ncbi:MAG: hypothetical protein IT422_22475 [Pirellulaceae bacterium]|nr:hypothetical protein [Pirellulaceae bacterium]
MAKASKPKKKTKAELLQEAVAEAVGAGRELHLESVDFSDPNRPKTCLEVDFPILPINHVAAIEGNAGKPIYQMSKWWARRRSSVFRAMLIAAATKAPDDPAEAAKLVWDSYYGNHQKNEAFRKLKVADIFMGGGTTIVEGSRLGMQMYGNDLNPVAWLVVKNEMAQVDSEEVQKLLDEIEAEVKPQIMPFYACDCPRGHKGKWTHKPTGEVMGNDFDSLSLTAEQRPEYEYEGPEVIYTFWAKHGPCQATECNHRTPIMSSPVVALKTLTVKAWEDRTCKTCGKEFDIEQKAARMAPSAMLVVADTEKPHAIMDAKGNYACPHCEAKFQDETAATDGRSLPLGKSGSKKIQLTLIVHPEWLAGTAGRDDEGNVYGGSSSDSIQATERWLKAASNSARVIEVRGKLPESLAVPGINSPFFLDSRGGTVPKKAHFSCAACGQVQYVLKTMTKYGKGAPFYPLYIQGYCPACDDIGEVYGGRFFAANAAPHSEIAAAKEWKTRETGDLVDWWPRTVVPEGFKTSYQRIAEHGYPRFVDMFNPRQLLVLTQLLREIVVARTTEQAKQFVLGAFQQYLRNQNMFCFWDISRDCMAPMMSNNNYHPKPLVTENCVFPSLGRGNWNTCASNLSSVIQWQKDPWEVLALSELERINPELASKFKSKGIRLELGDPVLSSASLTCSSSTALEDYETCTLDVVITDPPFGNNIQYAELADFFYSWLRIPFATTSDAFLSDVSPKSLEAVTNPVRNPGDPDGFYRKLLTECWKQAFRILKPAGLLAFTFHHSEDEPWVAVLQSLFDAGFYLEAAYPIRSDETKGAGAKPGTFGSQLIEYDIVHVCRKRLEESESISWAKLRRQITRDVRQLQDIIEQHQKEGLGEADLQVIRRGKALEYYSRHYGKVYIEKGHEDEFTVKDALVGINQLLDDESDTTTERPPELAEPYTRQFLRLFADKDSLDRDQIQKFLKGTGVSPSEFVERGWCTEEKKVFIIADPVGWAKEWKGKSRRAMARDFDQAYFLIGASYEDSGIKVSDTLNSPSFVPHPALGDLLQWFVQHAPNPEMKAATERARQLYKAWQAKNTTVVVKQRTLFDLED